MQQASLSIANRLANARQLVQQGCIEQAWQQVSELILENESRQEVLYLACVCQRYLKNYDKAIEFAQQLLKVAPNYGRGYQELAHIYREQENGQQAAQMYQQAVKFNPALIASWQQLELLAANNIPFLDLDQITAKLQYLTKLPPALVSVQSMIFEQRLLKAEQLCRHFLKQQPTHVEAMRLLAQIATKLNILDDAEFLLESALAFAPDDAWLQYDYVQVQHRRQRYAQAFKQAQKLLDLQPDNPSFMLTYANQCIAIGETRRALDYYLKVQQVLPRQAEVHLVTGHAYKTIGDRQQAEQAYQQAYQCRSDYGDAYWSLANLKNYLFSEQEVSQMLENLEQPSLDEDKIHTFFALGKAFEDLKNYQKSFYYYQQGNQLKASKVNFDRQRMRDEMKLQHEVFNQELIAETLDWGAQASDPIFIVGLPRSGSTLLEQIIASHSQVDGTLELPDIMAIAHQLNGRRNKQQTPRYPGCLSEMTREELKALGEQYLEQTQIHRKGAAFFIDKMPNNFRHIGLIKLILPQAKIIDARRNPMACCFSNFKQLYAEGQEFSYDFKSLASYYQEYLTLMQHWHALFPGEILTVNYEEVINDFDGQLARILDYLTLAFEPACKSFHQTKRAVKTASSEQVRQPLYQQGVDHWQAYQPYLSELSDLLTQ